MGKIKTILKNESGAVAAMTAMIMLVLLAISGLVIDSGLLVYDQLRLDESTNKAATAIVQSVDESASSSAGQVVFDEDLLLENSTYFLKVNVENAELISCEVDSEDEGVVYIKAKLKSKVYFSKIFGVEEYTLSSIAIGKVTKQTE